MAVEAEELEWIPEVGVERDLHVLFGPAVREPVVAPGGERLVPRPREVDFTVDYPVSPIQQVLDGGIGVEDTARACELGAPLEAPPVGADLIDTILEGTAHPNG